MKKVLILFAHPNFQKSRIQRSWLEHVSDLENVQVRDLYQLYPDFDVDPRAEQREVERHDVIVFQHPMYWYSTPALLKQWQDLVLEHGWAYGKDGLALVGKQLLCALSTGGKAEAYGHEGFHGVTVDELLAPVRQTARLCKMDFLPPFVGYGAFSSSSQDIARTAGNYRDLLIALRDEHQANDAGDGAQNASSPDARKPEAPREQEAH